MRIRFVAKDPDSVPNQSPTLYRTDRDRSWPHRSLPGVVRGGVGLVHSAPRVRA